MMETYASNRMESLCAMLARRLAKPAQRVFAKEVIVTPSGGMNAWLKTELAKENKVVANVSFQNQDGLLAAIYQLLFRERLARASETIRYRIYDLLDSGEFKERFAGVAAYCKDHDLRRFQLAGRIADLLDQYQLYRPEMVEGWEQGKRSTVNAQEEWQQWLWQKLGMASRKAIRQKIMDRLEQEKELIRETFPVISFFGITVYTPFHLAFFRALAEVTTVHFYLCLPTDQSPYHNELLESFGSKAAELSGMFDTGDFTGVLNGEEPLLARIQNRVLTNATHLEWKEDDSIQIHSCYTPVREAECLYNYLLDLFEKDQELKPSDVLVMCTDINKYAPYIRAVFRNAPVKIPFQVSGAAVNSEDGIVSALEKILSFTEEDLSAEKVVSLLEQKRIMERFGIRDSAYIRSVVHKANIRFGRENRQEDDTRYVSWRYGLEKIVLGYAMLTDEEFEDKYPYRDTEASVCYDLFRLKAFFHALEAVLDARKTSRSLASWKLFVLNEVVEKMVDHDDTDREDRQELNTVFKALSFAESAGYDKEVPFMVFMEELKTRLFTESRETMLNTGRVTVSSPVPVRGLPYRVICFLGLDNEVFPRRDRFMGFDLLGEAYRTGDRNKKETDKYLFLDTLLSARERLYLSYTGQSVKDNTTLPPSIVVDTLLDYMGQEEMVVRHPLHGFSARYGNGDGRLFTYLYGTTAGEYALRDRDATVVSEVSIDSLVKFFKAPIDWYFNTILDIRFEDNDSKLPETELFDLGYIQKWNLKQDLLKLEEKDVESYLRKARKEGILPLKSAGEVAIDRLTEDIQYIRQAYRKLVHNRTEEKMVIDIVIGTIRITGTIEDVYDKEFIHFCLSSDSLKYKVEAYVKSLLLMVTGNISAGKFVDREGLITPIPLADDGASRELEELIRYYIKGHQAPLLFTLKAAQAAAGNNSAADKILREFEKETYNPYLLILMREKYFEHFGDEEVKRITDLANSLKINQF